MNHSPPDDTKEMHKLAARKWRRIGLVAQEVSLSISGYDAAKWRIVRLANTLARRPKHRANIVLYLS